MLHTVIVGKWAHKEVMKFRGEMFSGKNPTHVGRNWMTAVPHDGLLSRQSCWNMTDLSHVSSKPPLDCLSQLSLLNDLIFAKLPCRKSRVVENAPTSRPETLMRSFDILIDMNSTLCFDLPATLDRVSSWSERFRTDYYFTMQPNSENREKRRC